jgi:hypothetical protein
LCAIPEVTVKLIRQVPRLALAVVVLGACGGSDSSRDVAAGDAEQDATTRVAMAEGFDGPEAVRYDPDQDVFFVSNFAGENAGDANGFISRVRPDGTIDSLRFMVGTAAAPLHGPRGLYLTGDTLWAADADGVHGFDRRSGAQVAFVDFRGFEPGFLNDMVAGPEGALYVTDTGRSRVYRLLGREVTIAVEDPRLGQPNGIAWDAETGRFVVAPWEGTLLHAWRPGGALEPVGSAGVNRCDGIEVLDGEILVACQADSTVHLIVDGRSRPLIRVAGRPADIGIDTRRQRVAVPYVALNRVDIWSLTGGSR